MKTIAASLVGILCSFALSSCVSETREQPSGPIAPASTESPVQARSVWDAYLKTYGRLLNDPRSGPGDMVPFVTTAQLRAVKTTLAQLDEAGFRVEGQASTRRFEIQTESNLRTVALVCIDNGQSRILDSKNDDVTPKNRKKEFTVRAVLVREGGAVLVDEDSAWTKSSAC